MPAAIFDLVDDLSVDPQKRDAIEQGATWTWRVNWQSAAVTGTLPADWSARMQVRRKFADVEEAESVTPILDLNSGDELTISIVDDTLTVDVVISATVTEDLPTGKGFRYDLELTRVADGYVKRVSEGKAQIRPEVTRV